MTRPLVLIPAYRLARDRVARWDDAAVAAPDRYARALTRAGATPVLLPPAGDEAPVDRLGAFDALMLIGGGDVNPSRYGGADHAKQYGVDDERDASEIALLREAVRIGMPVLAICRGSQVVNTAFGGTLIQHVPDAPGLGVHGPPSHYQLTMHDVEVEPDSRIAKATGCASLSCSSRHHQAVERLGDGLRPVGRSADGLVEAMEAEESWLVAVQWHPEHTADRDPPQQSLFDALADEAAEFRAAR